MLGKIDILEFTRFFKGNTSGYGVHIYDKPNDKGEKRSGKSLTKLEPLTERQYIEHLSGNVGLGISPINERNKCIFSVIDVDEYKIDFKKYFKINEDYNLPLCFFRSKSGGLHIYVFFDQEYPAKTVTETMKKLLIVLGLKSDTEIFPKQTKVQRNKIGNWINLPYFNEKNPTQYLYGKNGEKLSLTHALQYIKNQVVSIEELKDIITSVPFADAPPCLQTLYILNDFTKDSHNRNDFLFNVASYLKNKYEDDFPDKIRSINQQFPDPINEKELESTIINSHQRKTYSYNCKHPVLASVCNKEVCKKREYGIASLESPNIDYGKLVQYKGLSTRYEWEINGKILKFDSEDDIISQSTFLKLCIRELREYPFRLSQKRWDRVIREAVDEMEVAVDKDEFSNEILFKDYLIKFLTEGAMAKSKEQIGLHRVYEDQKVGCYVFKRVDLMEFLDSKHFFKLRPKEIKEIILKMEGREKRYHIKGNVSLKVWMIPFKSVDLRYQIMNQSDEELKEDFSEFQDEGEKEY